MKKYLKKEVIGDCTLYQGDCLDVMKIIPDKSVNMILTDPPYTKIIKEEWDKKNIFSNKVMIEWDRILKDNSNIYVWCGIGEKSRSLIDFIQTLDKYFYFKDLITWKKQRGVGMKKGWLYTREEILWYIKNKKSKYTWNKNFQYDLTDKRLFSLPNNKSDYKRWTNVWTDITEEAGGMKSAEYHPCQKPVRALERIINLCSNENEIILDCFMGSGSTGVACINTNRKFIGIEKEEKYFNIGVERIKDAVNTKKENKISNSFFGDD
jgi:site-specific DNA-methyltransferase (adenine-specific)